MSQSDGHGPKYGCTYNECGNPSAEKACPFTKDDGPDVSQHCKHQWRLRNYNTGHTTYFCIHCLTTKTVES